VERRLKVKSRRIEGKIMSKGKVGLVFCVGAFLLLVAVLGTVLNVPSVRGNGTIIIKADGSIDPPTAPIRRDGDLYTFTDNIYGWIGVDRSNTVINGAGYTVQGTGASYSYGISITSNVRIENTNIKGFAVGIHFSMWSSDNVPPDIFIPENIVIHGNNITNNNYGISGGGVGYGICSRNITISGNTIENNGNNGIDLYHAENTTLWGNTIINNGVGVSLADFGGPSNNIIYSNNFINNTIQAGSGMANTWDSGYPSGGNYWSDYAGVDANGDGIGDTPYSISYYAQDRYPLMNPVGYSPGVAPSATSGESNLPLIAGIVGAIVVIGVVAAVYVRRR
jgi:parallel beta-helix repeat protein